MSIRNAALVGILWLASLAVVATTVRAQAPAPQPGPAPRVQDVPAPEGRVITGGDIGFRLEGWQGKTPTGTLVVRLNGQWVEVATTKRPVLITR